MSGSVTRGREMNLYLGPNCKTDGKVTRDKGEGIFPKGKVTLLDRVRGDTLQLFTGCPQGLRLDRFVSLLSTVSSLW